MKPNAARLFTFKFVLVAAALAFSNLARAQGSDEVSRATRPILEGVPEVAVVRLRAVLAGSLSREQRRAANTKLGEALFAAEEPEEALKVLSDPELSGVPAAKFWRAQALAALSRWAEALPLYHDVAAQNGSGFHSEALYGEAEALRALGRFDDALQAFRRLTRHPRWRVRARLRSVELILVAKQDPAGATRILNLTQPKTEAEKKERRLLRGRIEAQLGKYERAVALFAPIAKDPAGASHSVFVAAVLGIADAYLQMGTPGAGDDFLEDFIERKPQDRNLPEIFAKLDQLYAAERKQSRHDLGRWSKDVAEPRSALAQWYLARAELRLGRRDVALQLFEQLRADHPAFPPLAEAFLEYARLQLEDDRFDRASAVLETARTLAPAPALLERINLLAGFGQFQAGSFQAAAQTYRQIARSPSPHANAALFNASLAWMQAGDAAEVEATKKELIERGADEQTRGELRLEQALAQAARGEKAAAGSLQSFVRDFPKDRRIAEAWVALAELAFHDAPPRIDEARRDLARAAQAQPTETANERADYLTIWMEEAGVTPDDAKVIALAAQFIQKYPASPRLADVRLKLAETSYRRQDFASAQTQFEILAQGKPGSPVAEKAEFFAAQSAMQTMGAASLDRALVLFDSVVKKSGEWKWAARNQQAVIERKLGKSDDALTLYEEVLKGDAKPAEKREALCGKGDILHELGAKDPQNYRRAIESYGQLAADGEAPAHWRNQALFKKGICLEKLNAPTEALATFYEIVESEGNPEREPEFFWFYKAGFNAARLLEENAKWQPAAAIYEKLAFAGGGRSEEAKGRLNRLRLKHFLWE
ncbi:MAG: tetratricopeptide repeat protein [Chthoniobacterales bacterium]|nr:tetratricopeptide repeat protein [Chthoniobacterales bacterium]